MNSSLLAGAAFLVLASPAAAANLTVLVQTSDGQPVRDAVVTLKPASGAAAGPIKFAWPYAMAQHNIAFDPFVLIVPAGADVAFPNKDSVRHHVYSFSATKKFELKLYGRDETRHVTFDKAGVVALGCNIHDQMLGYVYVVDTPYAAKTGADGAVTLQGVPAGAAAMTVWQPNMKTPKNQLVRNLTVAAGGGRETVSVDLRPAAMKMN
jgi:plastocyanin